MFVSKEMPFGSFQQAAEDPYACHYDTKKEQLKVKKEPQIVKLVGDS